MALPLIAARVTAGRAVARQGSQRGVQNARKNAPREQIRQRPTDTQMRRATIDEKARVGEGEYSSVKRSTALKQQEQSSREFNEARSETRARDRKNLRTGIKAARVLNKIKKPEVRATIKQTKNKARALRAAWVTVFPGAWIAAFILCFYLISIFGLGTAIVVSGFFDWIPFFGDDFADIAGKPGQWIFGGGWIISAVVGALTTLLCAVWFAVNRVYWWRSGILIFTFAASFALSIAPMVNFAPWYFLFVGMVALIYR